MGSHPPKTPGASLSVITSSGHDGHVVVASDALLSKIDALAHLVGALRVSAADLATLLDRPEFAPAMAADLPEAAADARRTADAALHDLSAAHSRASNIRRGILASLESYAHAEASAVSAAHVVSDHLAWGVGQFVRIFGIPLAIGGVEALAITCAIFRVSPSDLALHAQTVLREHGRILTNPFTVALIRETASDVGGFAAGVAGLPPAAVEPLDKARVLGVASSAAGVVGLAGLFGLFRETPVTVRKSSSFEFGKPATSLVDRSNSFPDPHADPNGEQIRIDRYIQSGKPDRFDVYVSGTVTFNPKAEKQPFDFTSDLTGVANESPGSLRALQQALAQAGVTPSSPVVFNGYSQGGLVASLAAASGQYNVKGVVTFGAPSGQVHIPASIPVLSVRNTEDLVPATSGYDVNPNAVVVERSVFSDSAVPTDWAVPAHRLEYYQETAAVVDSATSSQVRAVLDPLNSFGAGAQRVDSTLWVATRTSAVPAPVSPLISGGGSPLDRAAVAR